jgi:hypothetical protein
MNLTTNATNPMTNAMNPTMIAMNLMTNAMNPMKRWVHATCQRWLEH